MFVRLDEKEAELVNDLLSFWEEGMDEATRQTIEDRSIDSPEELLIAVDGLQVDVALVRQLKAKLAGQHCG